MKYQVGDKVLIRQWDDMENEFGLTKDGNINCDAVFMKEMSKYCGSIQRIRKINTYTYYMDNDDCYDYVFSDDMIERKVYDVMTKSDLRTGHIVTLRNGDEYSVVLNFQAEENPFLFRDVLINVDERDYVNLKCYKEDMTHSDDINEFDIVKVRPHVCEYFIGKPSADNDGNTIYERKERKEMTVAEIEKLLGYPVKIVKE